MNKYLSEEPWDEIQGLIYENINRLWDMYYYETGLTPIDYLMIDAFPMCSITVGEKDLTVRRVIMYEVVGVIRETLAMMGYHETVCVDFYDSYEEIIGIFMEKV